ncbi:glycosyltransferase [Lentisalinibacter orientalis]|uniref:glycosyltransferase n=1 Tax=Lentisalinibacter orientalis TaxID=2992241 RepID=UPI00386CD0E2
MNILIQTAGSRGDVEPYVALGEGLLRAGHRVTVNTCDRFRDFVEQRGLGYAFLNSSLVDLLDTETGRGAIEDMGSFFRAIRTVPRLMRESSDIQRSMLAEGWDAASSVDPDLILFNSKMAGAHYADRLGTAAVLAMPLPQFVPTGTFPALGFPRLPLGRIYNRLTYRVVHAAADRIGGKFVSEWRRAQGLPPAEGLGLLRRGDGDAVPVLHCYSENVVPRPDDWPDHVYVTGYWFLDRAEAWSPPAGLTDFLAAGPAPVHVGFGSMAGRDPARTTAIVLEAIARTGRRCILVTGWGGLAPDAVPDDVYVIDAVPYDWLLPRVAATVHHGGAGTTAAGLRAGRPSVICPFFGDQPFWGRRVRELGVGPAPIPQKRLSAAGLAGAIERACTDTAIGRRAEELGAQIRREDGIGRAVRLLERLAEQGRS